MRKTLTALALGAAMMMPPVLVPDAGADHAEWVFGGAFRIGDAYFNIGYFPAAHPVYYYRTRAPLYYRDHVCDDRCYHRGDYDYHHASCPLVQRHFRYHHFEPRTVFVRYAPRYHDHSFDRGRYYDRYYARGHQDYRYYDRGYYDRGRHDRRYYDRDRDRRHYDRGYSDRRHGDRRYSDRRHHDRGRYDRDDDRGRHRRHDRGRHRGHHRDRRWHDD